MTISRRAALSLPLLLSQNVFAAAAYPSQQIKLVVPAIAGSSTDRLGRFIAEGLRQQLGQAVIVENREGANGSLGAEYASKAKPDGYTLLLAAIGVLTINQYIYKSLRYDPERDFAPLLHAGYTPSVLVVNAASPYRSVADVVKAAKENPEKITFASAGNGTTGHIGGELINRQANVKMTHVPYKGNANLTAVLAGDVDMTFYHPVQVESLVKAGKLRSIGVTSSSRMSYIPSVPTMIEQGFPGFEIVVWYMLLTPRGVDPAVATTLRNAVQTAAKGPDFKRQLSEDRVEWIVMSPEQLDIFLDTERKKWRDLVKLAGASFT